MGADLEPDEPWETEISALLAGLGDVEPPDGFMEAAADHRPLHAGRTVVGLIVATVLALGLTLVGGIIERSNGIRLDDLSASLPGGYERDTATSEAADEPSLVSEILDLTSTLAEQLGFPSSGSS